MARIFLLVDLRDFFFRFRFGGGGMKKKITENDQSTEPQKYNYYFFQRNK